MRLLLYVRNSPLPWNTCFFRLQGRKGACEGGREQDAGGLEFTDYQQKELHNGYFDQRAGHVCGMGARYRSSYVVSHTGDYSSSTLMIATTTSCLRKQLCKFCPQLMHSATQNTFIR